MMLANSTTCSVCGTRFVPRFVYQTETGPDGVRAYCSVVCRVPELRPDSDRDRAEGKAQVEGKGQAQGDGRASPAADEVRTDDRRCSVCDQRFTATFAYQLLTVRGTPRQVCSEACRGLLLAPSPVPAMASATVTASASAMASAIVTASAAGMAPTMMTPTISLLPAIAPSPTMDGGPRTIAVQNAKGGTGKTTAAISVAAGFAQQGQRVLLVDIDPQGTVALSFDLHPPAPLTLFEHVVATDSRSNEAVVPLRKNLHVLPTDPFAPSLEAELRSGPEPEQRFAAALQGVLTTARYDVVIFDCPPSDGLLNACVRRVVSSVLMPISCDYLALAACKRVLRGLSREIRTTGHSLELRLLPTFYDPRSESSIAALRALEEYAPDRVLPPIRISKKIVDAPRHRKTIFEYARTSTAAKDFLQVVARLTAPSASQDAA